MANLRDIIAYILKTYPHKAELSNARVTKMVYLADWKNVLSNQQQLTEIKWFFDDFGPFVWNIKQTIDENKEFFKVTETINQFGKKKTLFSLKNEESIGINLSDDEKSIIDSVVENTKSLYWDDFITLVYSTYPVVSNTRYSHLDLSEAAKEYQAAV